MITNYGGEVSRLAYFFLLSFYLVIHLLFAALFLSFIIFLYLFPFISLSPFLFHHTSPGYDTKMPCMKHRIPPAPDRMGVQCSLLAARLDVVSWNTLYTVCPFLPDRH
jgi:hypothetical protein